ncbi:aldolase [Candidatus Poribacteria bacterium]|nr:aldolase [Candidatus Poribacteria bacterium]
MGIGKATRLKRIFNHPSGKFLSVAVDHFIAYGKGAHGIPDGIRHISKTLEALVKGKPDAVTMHKGIAASAWMPFAGKVPFIIQSTIARPDDTVEEQVANAEDAVRLGADALAVAAFICGKHEGRRLHIVADCVRDAAYFDLPVILHIYPREFGKDGPFISLKPEMVAWAVRCGLECGVDVIKTPYCGEVEAFRQIVSECPIPVVAAGGPKTETLESALKMASQVIQSGAKGLTVGRNIWGMPDITGALKAFQSVVYDTPNMN